MVPGREPQAVGAWGGVPLALQELVWERLPVAGARAELVHRDVADELVLGSRVGLLGLEDRGPVRSEGCGRICTGEWGASGGLGDCGEGYTSADLSPHLEMMQILVGVRVGVAGSGLVISASDVLQ